MRKTTIALAVMMLGAASAQAATPTTWTTVIDPSVYAGSTGTIKFNDWGYKGPTGVGANDFQVGAGFDSSRIGQVQRVLTTGPDWNTPDPGHNINADLYGVYPPDYSVTGVPNANMDSGVNFYKWGYTTVAGSTFNTMQIDKAGNYNIARNDMTFQFYDTFATPSATYDTNINFKPYAISDAKGWCGSVLSSNPNGLEQMAGQVTFDFAFDADTDNMPYAGNTGAGTAIQIVPGFVMRSYGDYEVTVAVNNDPNEVMHYTGSAVGNNTNPLAPLVADPVTGALTRALDPAYQNKVSFLGAGVVPTGVWININATRADGTIDYSVASTQGANGTVADEVRADGATWHFNAFAGFPFLMRADGARTLEWINPAGHSDYTSTAAAAYTSIGMQAPVPTPAALWLLGSGLVGLAGFARRRFG